MNLNFNLQHRSLPQKAFIMPTLVAFMAIIAILGPVVMLVSLQAQQQSIRQQHIQQAQLASLTAIEIAKEQYELDINYGGAAETTLFDNGDFRVTYEIESFGYTNDVNTQQDIRGTGRVYAGSDTEPISVRELRSKITKGSGGTSRVRFIFIVDNSGSMDDTEWAASKLTVDRASDYVIDNIATAELAVVQYGTNHDTQEHTYDVTVPFTNDKTTAKNWYRNYGSGSPNPRYYQDHLPASLAIMRLDDVYGPGDALDLAGASDVQYILFSDARGENTSWCCSSLEKLAGEPSWWFSGNGGGFSESSVLDSFGEYNVLKDGTVFNDDGYPGLTSQFTVLNVNTTTGNPVAVSAAIASPGGDHNGVIDTNVDDPEGGGILPRRLITDDFAQQGDAVIEVIQEIIDEELSF